MALITTPTEVSPSPGMPSIATGQAYGGNFPQIIAYAAFNIDDVLHPEGSSDAALQPHWS